MMDPTENAAVHIRRSLRAIGIVALAVAVLAPVAGPAPVIE